MEDCTLKRSTLKATIHTYKDWELENLVELYARHEDGTENDAIKQMKLCQAELKRRQRPGYVDETLPGPVSIEKRLALVSNTSK